MTSALDSNTYYSYTFDINQYEPCTDSTTTNTSYLGQWKNTSGTLIYLEFTTDSVYLYQFDSIGCYRLSFLTCTDLGNNQLLISGLITTNYSLSDNNEIMNVNISVLGDLELQRTPFDVNDWVECTYNWKCISFSCDDVGLNNGTFNSQSDCQAVCQDTTTSITEIQKGLAVYPNPFSEYTTLSFDDNVGRYLLLDHSGRILLNRKVKQSTEYLFRGNLKKGLYLIRYITENGFYNQKIVIF